MPFRCCNFSGSCICIQHIFFHPDFTVGIGIAPIHTLKRLADYTAGREFHPALKTRLFSCSAYTITWLMPDCNTLGYIFIPGEGRCPPRPGGACKTGAATPADRGRRPAPFAGCACPPGGPAHRVPLPSSLTTIIHRGRGRVKERGRGGNGIFGQARANELKLSFADGMIFPGKKTGGRIRCWNTLKRQNPRTRGS